MKVKLESYKNGNNYSEVFFATVKHAIEIIKSENHNGEKITAKSLHDLNMIDYQVMKFSKA